MSAPRLGGDEQRLARLAAVDRDQRVLDVLQRDQHGLPVGGKRGVRGRLLLLDARAQLAALEDRGADAAEQAAENIGGEIAEIAARRAERSGEAQRRIELRLGDADARQLGDEILLRDDQVGAAREQVGRQAGFDAVGAERDGLCGSQLGLDRAGRDAEQDGKLVGVALEGLLDVRNAGGRLKALGNGLLQLDFAGEAGVGAPLHDLQRIVLNAQILAGDGKACLLLAGIDIIERDFGDEAALHVGKAGGAAVGSGARRFDRAREAPENVRFP